MASESRWLREDPEAVAGELGLAGLLAARECLSAVVEDVPSDRALELLLAVLRRQPEAATPEIAGRVLTEGAVAKAFQQDEVVYRGTWTAVARLLCHGAATREQAFAVAKVLEQRLPDALEAYAAVAGRLSPAAARGALQRMESSLLERQGSQHVKKASLACLDGLWSAAPGKAAEAADRLCRDLASRHELTPLVALDLATVASVAIKAAVVTDDIDKDAILNVATMATAVDAVEAKARDDSKFVEALATLTLAVVDTLGPFSRKRGTIFGRAARTAVDVAPDSETALRALAAVARALGPGLTLDPSTVARLATTILQALDDDDDENDDPEVGDDDDDERRRHHHRLAKKRRRTLDVPRPSPNRRGGLTASVDALRDVILYCGGSLPVRSRALVDGGADELLRAGRGLDGGAAALLTPDAAGTRVDLVAAADRSELRGVVDAILRPRVPRENDLATPQVPEATPPGDVGGSSELPLVEGTTPQATEEPIDVLEKKKISELPPEDHVLDAPLPTAPPAEEVVVVDNDPMVVDDAPSPGAPPPPPPPQPSSTPPEDHENNAILVDDAAPQSTSAPAPVEDDDDDDDEFPDIVT